MLVQVALLAAFAFTAALGVIVAFKKRNAFAVPSAVAARTAATTSEALTMVITTYALYLAADKVFTKMMEKRLVTVVTAALLLTTSKVAVTTSYRYHSHLGHLKK